MNRKIFSLASALLIVWVFGAAPAYATSKNQAASRARTDRIIERAHSGASIHIRTEAAKELMAISRTNPAGIGDRQIDTIATLLDSSDDSVRYWVARCLGNLGSRAARTVPKLLEILPHADCLRGSLTSASAIRLALTQLDTVPPADACSAGDQLR